VPDARPSSNYDPLGNGARSLLVLDNIELFGQPFKGKFYFQGESLYEVMLSLTPQPTANQGKATFDNLRVALRAKYGPEINTGGVVNSVGSIINPTWISGGTNIELTYVSIGGGDAVVNVVYQARVGKEAAKL